MAESGCLDQKCILVLFIRPIPELGQVGNQKMIRADIPAETCDTGKPYVLVDLGISGLQAINLADTG